MPWRQRLREIAAIINRTDLVDLSPDEKALPEQLRNELTAAIYAKEIELADLTGYEAELTDIEAAIASMAGGSDAQGNDGDPDTEKE